MYRRQDGLLQSIPDVSFSSSSSPLLHYIPLSAPKYWDICILYIELPVVCASLRIVLYPGKGECADPVNEDAILKVGGGGSPRTRMGSVS